MPLLLDDETHSAINAKARTLEADRILIMDIEQIVDPTEDADLVVDRVVRGEVNQRERRSENSAYGAISADIDPRADVKDGRGETELVDGLPSGRHAFLDPRSA